MSEQRDQQPVNWEELEAPEEVVPSGDDEREVASYYETLGAKGVHSMDSLLASRYASVHLLSFLDGAHQQNTAKELIDQEIKLQESIRHRDFSDGEMIMRLRRAVGTWFVIIGLFLSVVAWMVPFFGNMPNDKLSILVDYSKWILGGTVITLSAYLFSGKK